MQRSPGSVRAASRRDWSHRDWSRRSLARRRSGNKVLLVQRNVSYRATTQDEPERRAIEDSFASSVLADFTIEAEQDGRVLVNATELALRDSHDISGRLRRSRQGAFTQNATWGRTAGADFAGEIQRVVPAQRAHLAHGQRLIERFLADPREFLPPPAPPIPPGQPIGEAKCESDAGI